MICTSMVVVLHIFQQMEKLCGSIRCVTDWLNLGLVMFFCISAYLYSRRKITDVFKWYIHRYLEIAIPSVIVGICTVLVFVARGEMNVDKLLGSVLSIFGLQAYAKNSWMFVQLWFLTYILFFYLTVPLVQRIKCERASAFKFWGVFAAVVVATQCATVMIEKIAGVPLLSVGILLRFYLPYFTFKKYDINGKAIKPIMYVFTAVSAVAFLFVCWIRYTPNFGLPAALCELLFVYAQTLIGYTLFYWLYIAFACLKNYTSFLRISDKYSYEVYLTHCLFIGYSTSLIFAVNNIALGIFLSLLLTAIASIVLNFLSTQAKKPINKVLRR